MNLRINGQELRFRVGKEELESLCVGETLKQSTHLTNNKILETCITTNYTGSGMSISNENDNFTLYVNKGLAAKFLDSLPSKEGLEATQKINDEQFLTLILEVDIRTQKRKKIAEE